MKVNWDKQGLKTWIWTHFLDIIMMEKSWWRWLFLIWFWDRLMVYRFNYSSITAICEAFITKRCVMLPYLYIRESVLVWHLFDVVDIKRSYPVRVTCQTVFCSLIFFWNLRKSLKLSIEPWKMEESWKCRKND